MPLKKLELHIEPVNDTPACDTWCNCPPSETPHATYKLVRAQAGSPQKWILLSDDVQGCVTHYYNRRTVQHRKENCIPCAAGNAGRWFGFLGVYNPKTGVVAILELPASTVNAIREKYDLVQKLRGKVITIERVPAVANGTVHAHIVTTHFDTATLPAAPPIEKVLERMWDRNIRGMNESERSK